MTIALTTKLALATDAKIHVQAHAESIRIVELKHIIQFVPASQDIQAIRSQDVIQYLNVYQNVILVYQIPAELIQYVK